ncbi:RagB/SusD family nutrient uptake outer membrane protein [Ekhidna sp.]
MKKISIYIAVLFLITACEITDVLENDPPNNLVPENVILEEKDAEALLNGVYSLIISRVSASYYMDYEHIPSALIGSMSRSGAGVSHDQIRENDLLFDNSIIKNFWTAFYRVMDQANNVITLTSEFPDNEFSGNNKAEILGEARFLRAMATFDVLRYYGQFYDQSSNLGIVLRTEPSNFVTRSKERSTVAACYEQILSDLDFAIENAPDFSVTFRASKTAAKALKARVLLFQGAYAEAAALAGEVIMDGTRDLEADFASVFSTGLNSSEMIFMTHRDENSDTDQNNRKRFYTGRAGTMWFETLMTGDPRQPLTYTSITSAVGLKVNNVANFRPTYYIRLAEMYLIQAEGLAFSGATLADSKAPLDIIRNRAGIGDSPALTIEDLRDDIFDEIVRELAFENGSEWFAAIRFDKAMTLKPSITSVNQYILPIPEEEINGNGNISLTDQNPGYE